MTEEIPGPRALPLIGNILDLQDEVPLHALERLVDVYGSIFRIKVPDERIVVGRFDLFDELCDETRFYKVSSKALKSLANGAKSEGLFTAATEKSEDWGVAHRVLVPAFGPLAIQDMFDEMHDIASQLVLKWARMGSSYKIPVTKDFTRLTLDTIALCAMDFRFNSFYQDDMHPFVDAMNRVLKSRSEANQISSIFKRMAPSYKAGLDRDSEYQKQLAEELVRVRRENPTEKKDLLNAMIYGKDPKTGKTMSDGLIAANMVTFLIAGHETTSGLLSFAVMYMLKNPKTYFTAQQEVDRVVGKGKIEVKHLSELKFINAVLRETLRLNPTAPGYTRGPRPENKEVNPTIGGGRYAVPEDGILCLMGKIQRDPAVWGPDAEEFRPERMMDGKFESLPKNAWKPFGTGMRGCIGRAFAWQEALLVVALVLQNFELRLDDPCYELKIDQSLTIKPRDLYIRASLRPGLSAAELQSRLSSNSSAELKTSSPENSLNNHAASHSVPKPIQILYGTTTGTTQSFAQKLAAQLSARGWTPLVHDLDFGVNKISKGTPLVVVTSSYEGQPPDNGNLFVAWLEKMTDKHAFEGVSYAVFGCGHSDWRQTFQRIPILVDDALASHGATRLIERGFSDAAKGDVLTPFEDWMEKSLLPALSSTEEAAGSSAGTGLEPPTLSVEPKVELELSSRGRASHLQHNVQWGSVISVKCLTPPSQPQTRHIEIQLPETMSYNVGDYLVVLPLNPDDQVKRVVKKFSLPWDSIISISGEGSTILPTSTPLPLVELLKGYVELSQPATRKDIQFLVKYVRDPAQKEELKNLGKEDVYSTAVLDARISVLDIVETYGSIDMPFANFLALLPPLKLRHYSISSSPLMNSTTCALTYSVIDAPALSGLPGRFQGVAGTHLQTLQPGDGVQVSVRSTNKFFRLPIDPEKTPIIMFCAGTGLAPFRGFVQERACLIKEGRRKLAPALLFIGCRAPAQDLLYADEMREWASIGAVDVRYAFSREPESSDGCRYVQDRMLHDKKAIYDMWNEGAKFYICGGREVAKEIGRAARQLLKEKAVEHGKALTEEQLEAWLVDKKNERFISDIFS